MSNLRMQTTLESLTKPNAAMQLNPARRGATIKALLLGAFAMLSVLLLCALSWKVVGEWNTHTSARNAQQFDAGANRFITGLFEVLIERLATNNGLQASDPASPSLRQEIDTRRKASAESFELGLATLERQAFPQKDQLLRDLRAALDIANQARKQADLALAMPRDRRDEALLKSFVPSITASVNAALKVWFSALHESANADPVLAKLATIKEIGWTMRDFSGRERSNISSAISAGKPIAPEMLTANAGFRAQVDGLWQQLQNLTYSADTHAAIRGAMADSREHYFGGFVKLADELRKLSDEGAKYPMTAQQYVDVTTPQIGKLLDVMYAAGKASEERTATMLFDSLVSLAVAGTLAVLDRKSVV
jgi:hypothetical protein